MIIRNKEATCSNCPFWDAEHAEIVELPRKTEDAPKVMLRQAHCRANPPSPVSMPRLVQAPGSAIVTAKGAPPPQMTVAVVWNLPGLVEDFWCGRHPEILTTQKEVE